jgi:KDO2-lipid IV(A) lauroyltransferase
MYQSEKPKPNLSFLLFVYPFLWIIGNLPFFILYRLADLIFVLIFHVFKYRRGIVLSNLKNSFPEKSETELKKIEKSYYKHLADLILETIKGISITEKQLRRRSKNIDQSVFDNFFEKKKNFIVVMSHCGNWEWVCLMSQPVCKQQIICTYKTLSNKGFNWLMYSVRSKFKAMPVHMNETLKAILKSKDVVNTTALIGDQNPSNTNNVYWGTFLNQETAFFNGPAKIAKKLGYPLVYMSSRKVKRGHYETYTEIIVDDVSAYSEAEISEIIVRKTENEILAQPEIWLWSHRRWKHKRTH